MENADASSGLHDFLERMRQPAAADFVKAIKSFIVSFSNHGPDPDRDSDAVQDFLANMEAAFKAHPLWSGCSDDELESAGEGLEKYVMTKLFPRVFASVPDDVKLDDQLSEKMALIQQFIRPENLDIKPAFQNETSWLLAQKELQKINMYKAPRDKLTCILNCCKVIGNLLLNASLASKDNPPGADEFLPVLIYVTLKANPPQLHSNLLYIQRFRRQSRLVGEASYYFTNMLSAESFISNIDAKAISMDETEFERNMEFARALLSGLSVDTHDPNSPYQIHGQHDKNKAPSSDAKLESKKVTFAGESSITKVPSLSDLENKGASMIIKEDKLNDVFREFPYLFASVGDLTVSDVEDLLKNYKRLVSKYVCLSKGLGVSSTSHLPSNPQSNAQQDHVETLSRGLASSSSSYLPSNPQKNAQQDHVETLSKGLASSSSSHLPSNPQNNAQDHVESETTIDSSDNGPVASNEKSEKSPDTSEDNSDPEKKSDSGLAQDEAAAPEGGAPS